MRRRVERKAREVVAQSSLQGRPVAMEDTAASVWAVVTIAGPIVLGLAAAYATLRNRRRRRARVARRGSRG